MISVVIPAFNEEELLAQCLTAIKAQTYSDFEVIVVVTPGDRTAEIARSFGARTITEPQRGVARARQAGFEAARGDIIASTDADTIVPPDWLSRIEELFRRYPKIIAVAGHFQFYDGPAFVRWWVRVSLLLMPIILKIAPWLWNFGGFNFAVKTSVFHMIGGFNKDFGFGEDVDLCRRLKRSGKVIFDSRLVVKASGRAFLVDHWGFRNLTNYLSVAVRGKSCLPFVQGSEAVKRAKLTTNKAAHTHKNGITM